MKRVVSLFLTVLMIAGARVMWAAEDFTSENVVGQFVMTIPEGGQIRMLAVGMKAVGGTNPTLLELFGTDQLIQSTEIGGCDLITIWDPVSNSYQTYAQYTNGDFFKANDATEWAAEILANDTVVASGSAMWFKGKSHTSDRDIVIFGEVVDAASVSMSLVEGFQMIGYLYTAERTINDLGFYDSGAAKDDVMGACDRITVWDPATSTYQTYALWTDGLWYKANTAREWNTGTPAGKTFQVGDGFWYNARGTLNYQEAIPYTLYTLDPLD